VIPSAAPPIVFDAVRFSYPAGSTMTFETVVPGGSITAVMGPSGSGKSTLFSLIAGFERPAVGRVLIGGADVGALPPAARPVSIVFQDNNLFAHLDVATNIALGMGPRTSKAGRRERTVQALHRVGLAGFEKRRPDSLSGGERQRVALARAIVRERPVLLLDEPFAALGPGLRDDMVELVRGLHRDNGLTTMLITHQPDEARALADRVLYIEGGRIAANEPLSAMFARRDLAGWLDYLGS